MSETKKAPRYAVGRKAIYAINNDPVEVMSIVPGNDHFAYMVKDSKGITFRASEGELA